MKKKTDYSLFSFFFLFPLFFFSQESLLDQIEYQNEDYRVGLSAFKAHKIVNGQSTKQSKEKELYLYVAHRFGNINEGIRTLFGLDIANTKIEMLYGFSDNFQVGFSRESLDKTYSINFKNKIADQNSGFPLNISFYNSFNYNSSDFLAPGTELTFSQRSLFLTQILISNRISDKISLQISPSFIKRNYNRERILFIDNTPTVTTYDRENNYLLGISSSYKINKRTSLNIFSLQLKQFLVYQMQIFHYQQHQEYY